MRTYGFRIKLPESTQNKRYYGTADPDQHDRIEMIPDNRNIAEEIAAQHQTAYPNDGAGDIVDLELDQMHFGHACDKRRERTNQWNETAHRDRFAAMFFKKQMRMMQCLFIDPPIVLCEHGSADLASDKIIQVITDNGCDNQQNHQQFRIQCARGTKSARDEQQRVSRQKRHDDQAGLAKHDGKQDDIDPGAVLGNHRAQHFIDMQDHAEQLHDIHNRKTYKKNKPEV